MSQHLHEGKVVAMEWRSARIFFDASKPETASGHRGKESMKSEFYKGADKGRFLISRDEPS